MDQVEGKEQRAEKRRRKERENEMPRAAALPRSQAGCSIVSLLDWISLYCSSPALCGTGFAPFQFGDSGPEQTGSGAVPVRVLGMGWTLRSSSWHSPLPSFPFYPSLRIPVCPSLILQYMQTFKQTPFQRTIANAEINRAGNKQNS